jgi:predicted dehydrogenase
MRDKINRRNFLKTASAIVGFTIVKSKSVLGTPANSKIRLGLIGCGNRGTYVASSFMEHTDTQIVAIADLFEDKLMKGKEHFNRICRSKGYPELKDSNLFLGSKGYMRLLELKDVDAVQISTPTFLHSEMLVASIDAGKHVYCEKPVAVDVYGCKRAILVGERANGRLSVAIGLQIRCATPFVEMVKIIHNGAIGDIVMGQAYYLTGFMEKPVIQNVSIDEMKVRNFYHYNELCGGCILDQGVHVIDVCNWILKSHPIKATGIGGRKGRPDSGNIWSYFAVNFEYPNKVPVAFQETQFSIGYDDVCERFFGTKGISESHYTGGVFIIGENKWDSGVARGTREEISKKTWETGVFKSALEDADANKEKAFIDSIKSGNYINEAKQGAESTLSAILGRTASYSGEEVTWDKMLASDEKWEAMVDLTKFDRK